MVDRVRPMIVRGWDVRLGQQFDEHANREHLVCGPECALDYVQTRGGDVSKATGGRNDAFVPHISGEPGYGHTLVNASPHELPELRKNKARCTNCRDVI